MPSSLITLRSSKANSPAVRGRFAGSLARAFTIRWSRLAGGGGRYPPRSRLGAQVAVEDLLQAAFEGGAAGQALVEEDGECVDVGGRRRRLGADALGCEIRGRASDGGGGDDLFGVDG